MARSSKQSADAPPKPIVGAAPTRTSNGSSTRTSNGSSTRTSNGSATRWTNGSPPAPAAVSPVRAVRQAPGPVGLGSPIYEELVATLGDPTS